MKFKRYGRSYKRHKQTATTGPRQQSNLFSGDFLCLCNKKWNFFELREIFLDFLVCKMQG